MADSHGPQKDWYSILGACPTDDIQELKQKYQKLILTFHLDKQRPDVSEGEAEQHLQRFIDVDQAWKILSNEESRKEYNLQLRALELKQSWPVDAHITLDDMNWDCGTECYTYSCRCGGEFILEKDGTQEVEMVVCCDSCSLSIEVKKMFDKDHLLGDVFPFSVSSQSKFLIEEKSDVVEKAGRSFLLSTEYLECHSSTVTAPAERPLYSRSCFSLKNLTIHGSPFPHLQSSIPRKSFT